MPIITLLTDFGLQDAYVGIMKGVILDRCAGATIVDLTHDVGQGDVRAAGYLLAGACGYFPAGAVHTVVVDPGVGSGRRILAAEAGGRVFLAPDNGVLTMAFDEHEPAKVVSVENEQWFRHPVSRTFHGRDIFAPVAAALARGTPLDALGPATDAWIHLPRLEPRREGSGILVGEVIYVDRFGNLVTNLTGDGVPKDATVEVAGRVIGGLRSSYASVDEGRPLAIVGSTGRIEISVNGGDAAALLNAAVGERVCVRS